MLGIEGEGYGHLKQGVQKSGVRRKVVAGGSDMSWNDSPVKSSCVAALALSACALLAGCEKAAGWVKKASDAAESAVALEPSKDSGSVSWHGKPMDPVNMAVEDKRALTKSSLSLEGLQAGLPKGLGASELALKVTVEPGPLSEVDANMQSPLFKVEAMKAPLVKKVWLRLPFDVGTAEKASGAPSVLRMLDSGGLSIVMGAEVDLSNGWASFQADLPGNYLVVPKGLEVGKGTRVSSTKP